MRFTINKMPIGLTGQSALRLEHASGTTMRVMRGRIWVTQEGCIDDVFLDPGCEYRFRNDGRVLISVEGGRSAAATVAFEDELSVHTETSILSRLRRMLGFGIEGSAGSSTTAISCP